MWFLIWTFQDDGPDQRSGMTVQTKVRDNSQDQRSNLSSENFHVLVQKSEPSSGATKFYQIFLEFFSNGRLKVCPVAMEMSQSEVFFCLCLF